MASEQNVLFINEFRER